MRSRVAGLVAAALGISASTAGAQQVTTRAQLNSILTTSTIETFAGIANANGGQTNIPGPVVSNTTDSRFVAGVTYSLAGPPSRYTPLFFSPGPGLLGYASDAFEAGQNTLRISFNSFTSAFGFNAAQYNGYAENASVSVFRGATMLGSATVLADNAPSFSFFGWQDAGGIDYVEIQGGTWDWSPSVDDVQWGTTNAVNTAPEPASIGLMATGMLSLVGVQLRRRKKLTA